MFKRKHKSIVGRFSERVRVKYSFEQLAKILFESDIDIINVDIDYSRRIVNIDILGYPSVSVKEGQEAQVIELPLKKENNGH